MKIEREVNLTVTFENKEVHTLLIALIAAKDAVKLGEYPHSFIASTISKLNKAYKGEEE